MDQLGEIWAELLETLVNSRYDDAVNHFMRLTNVASRMEGNIQQVGLELRKEAETRLTGSLAKDIQKICKGSISRVRNGDLTTAEADSAEAIRLLRLRVGVDLLLKDQSNSDTTKDCREPIKQMLCTQLAVRGAQTLHGLKSRLDVKKKAKSLVTSPDDGFLDAVQEIINYTLNALQLYQQGQIAFDDPRTNFAAGLQTELIANGVNAIKQIVNLFLEDRRIKTVWYKKTDELGGLTLPRTLNNRPGSGPKNPKGKTPPPVWEEPLSEEEAASLDLALHEISQILSLCEELRVVDKTSIQDVSIEMVSSLVKLDDLWLTHNITKAVTHAVFYEIEPTIMVNSVSEDVFHVASTSFARAVTSQSLLAVEASANHVASFVEDGFCTILEGMVMTASKDATDEIGSLLLNDVKDKSGLTLQHSNVPYAGLAAALNTLASASILANDFQLEMSDAFEKVFDASHAMAPGLIQDAVSKMNKLLNSSCSGLSRSLLRSKSLDVLMRRFEPRDHPFELTAIQFERESISKTSWVREFVDVQFTKNEQFRACLQMLSTLPRTKVVEALVKSVCDTVESKLNQLRFSALGALQLDKDLRALCDSILTELKSIINAGVSGDDDAPMTSEDERQLDTVVRPLFARLRHWTFLLNLQRASDEKEYEYPGRILSDNEIANVLKKRIEKDFFA